MDCQATLVKWLLVMGCDVSETPNDFMATYQH